MGNDHPATVLERLGAFVGAWDMEAAFPSLPVTEARARTVFEWLPGERFLVQRWEVDVPEAPDGIAIIGIHEGGQDLLQHYFDSRGVARVYEMTFDGRTWTLTRTSEDFSPLDFRQRFTGTFSDDGREIRGAWESSNDGTTWEHDFELIYRRVE